MTHTRSLPARSLLRTLAVLGAVTLALAGCAPTSGAPSADIYGDWRLTEGGDADGAFDLSLAGAGALPSLSIDEEQSGGQTPCNRFGANVSGGIGEIDVTPTFQTEAACADPELQAIEPRYLAALDAVTSAAFDGDILVLTGERVELRFERLDPIAASDLIGTDWRLESTVDAAGGQDGAASSVLGNGRLLFSITGELSGNAGCRDLTGRYTIDGGAILVTNLTMAAADCPAEFVEQEDRVVSVLGERFAATIEDDTLTLTADTAGLALVYRAG